ncbi:carbohydrate kinase [Amycolatopsis sp. K13G38]|uniref:Carbohydrate kinase n=1 Tax=Amycolatopsis acididurans TaxID=2724524 RepID=A0ABX1JBF5_9PSEU|nr:FGGY family carbohydrate kinase [Amycolatopsis acididurans]NKQ57093.1 carbohydrate kinase [Amycolatopsis acididurans]
MTVVGIDVATAGVRAFAVADDGRVLARASESLPAPVRSEDGCSEQDASTWWPAVESVVRQVSEGLSVQAVAVSATSGTIVAVDERGEPVSPALMYDDRRGAPYNTKAAELGGERWRALGMSVSPTAALGRIAWLHSAFPDAAGIVHTPDLICARLTGAAVATDWSHALKSGYDPRAGEWAFEVFDALGVPRSWLPEVVAPTAALGEVSRPVAGLPAGCRVVAGMTDGCAGQLATGAVLPGTFAGILGTTYVLKGVTEQLVPDPSGAMYSHRHPDGWWLPGGASNTGGEGVTGDLARLDELAARGPAKVVAYPLARSGERFPFVTPDARGFVLGTPADEGELHRARLEGVAFVERLALEHLRGLGVEVRGPLLAAGGGSKSPLWIKIRATVTGLGLRASPRAETAYGAALLAAAAITPGGLAEVSARLPEGGTVVDPDPTETEALEESYQRFVAELRGRGWLA